MPSPIVGMIGASAVGGLGSAYAASKGAKAQTDAANAANATERYIFDRSVELTEPQRQAGNNAIAAMQYELGLGPKPGLTQYNIDEVTTPAQAAVYRPGSNGGMGFWTGGGGDGGMQFSGGNALVSPAVPASTQYYVGDRAFDTRDAAQGWIDQQPNFEYGGFKESPGYQFTLGEGMKGIERGAAARGLRMSSGTIKDMGRFNSGLASQDYGNFYNRLAGLGGIGQTATAQQIGAGQNYAGAYGQNALAAGNARASGYAGMANSFNNTMGDISGLMMLKKMGVF